VKVREHRGGLSESLLTVREISDRAELVALIREQLGRFHHQVEEKDVHVERYAYDDRIKWDTHLITVDGYGVWGMADGPIPSGVAAG
jgi:hypothetical protein